MRALFSQIDFERVRMYESDNLNAIAEAGQSFSIMDGQGRVVGAYVLEADGSDLWITAAIGKARIDLTACINALVCAQAVRYERVCFRTKRRGLVRKACRHGFEVESDEGGRYIMRKKIK